MGGLTRGKDQKTYPHEIEVVQGIRPRFGTAQADQDDTNQRGDCENIGREDARDPTRFAHVGDWLPMEGGIKRKKSQE